LVVIFFFDVVLVVTEKKIGFGGDFD